MVGPDKSISESLHPCVVVVRVFFHNVLGVGLQGPPYLKLGPLLTRSRIAGFEHIDNV